MNYIVSKRTLRAVVFFVLLSLHLLVPRNVTSSMAASAGPLISVAPAAAKQPPADTLKPSIPILELPAKDSSLLAADALYSSLGLARKGLSRQAFQIAWKGYKSLVSKGKIGREEILSICDFSQSSKSRRLYIIDVEEKKLLMQTFVAHGRNSGSEFARNFSNRPESHQSSLGFYVTRSTYYGEHGLSLKIDGLERGINDKAFARHIVVHGSDYVGKDFLKSNKVTGRSFGCPAVPREQAPKIIETIKQGSCLFIYHPSKKYLNSSKILNV
jgi:hypothetical protein